MRPAPSRVLTYLLLASGLVLFVPWDPIASTDSYEYSMHLAAVHGWQFGTEVVGTYGPLGFLGLPLFHPGTFGKLIAANLTLYVMAALWLRRYWQDVGGPGTAPALWTVLVLVLPAFMSTSVYSPALYAPFVLANAFVVRHFIAGADASRFDEAVTISLLAACCLVKPTLAVVILAAVAIVATDQVVTWRRFPWQVAVLVAALGLEWVASGQEFGHVARYLVTATDVTVGFKDAMSLRSPRSDALALVFVAAGAVLLGVLARAMWKRLRWRSLGPAATFALTVLVVFQHGFTRADEPHILPACLALAALALGMLPVLPRAHPLPMQLIRLDERRAALDEVIPVPDHGSDLLWVEIDLKPTVRGWLFGMAYQPAPAFITVSSETETGTFRLTNAMTREGMVLAPLRKLEHGFEWLYASPRSRATAEVRSLRLSIGRGLAWCYRATVAVTFFRMVVPA